ncbi:MAG: Pr6Pr family membrane protein [Dysgonomonas sp.]|nr:Pr6Pr family membrane protein [Dysgonomonas sp.]
MAARNTYRIFYIVIGVVGLLIQLGVFTGTFFVSSLNYYTILSNILCVAYFTLRLRFDYVVTENTKFRDFLMSPLVKYSVTMCITLTFLVYHFMLAPLEASKGGVDMFTFGNYIVHYIIPVMTIIDFLIFDTQRDSLKWYAPFVWIIVPVIYFIFIIIRAPFFGNIGDTSSAYPYEFIDFSIQPVSAVLVTVVVLVAIFIAIGYVLLFLDRILRRREVVK